MKVALKHHSILLGIALCSTLMSCNKAKESSSVKNDAATITPMSEATASITNTSTPPKVSGDVFYIGSYTRKEGHVDGKAHGIMRAILQEDGTIVSDGIYASGINPSFISIHPSKRFVYAVNETGGTPSEPYGRIEAFAIDENQNLSKLNEAVTQGVAPCYISTAIYGNYVLTANYSSGSINLFVIKADGSVGPMTDMVIFGGSGSDPDRQMQSHAHFIAQGFDDLIFTADLGSDSIRIFKIDGNKFVSVDGVKTSSGAGPRHIGFHPSLSIFYVINELNGTIESFRKQSSGIYERVQVLSSVGNKDGIKSGSADIAVHSSGRFLYATNRGVYNTIALIRLDEKGIMRYDQEENSLGEVPRNIAISPSGNHLLVANQNSNNIVSFKINALDGSLSDPKVAEGIMTPVCIGFL